MLSKARPTPAVRLPALFTAGPDCRAHLGVLCVRYQFFYVAGWVDHCEARRSWTVMTSKASRSSLGHQRGSQDRRTTPSGSNDSKSRAGPPSETLGACMHAAGVRPNCLQCLLLLLLFLLFILQA